MTLWAASVNSFSVPLFSCVVIGLAPTGSTQPAADCQNATTEAKKPGSTRSSNSALSHFLWRAYEHHRHRVVPNRSPRNSCITIWGWLERKAKRGKMNRTKIVSHLGQEDGTGWNYYDDVALRIGVAFVQLDECQSPWRAHIISSFVCVISKALTAKEKMTIPCKIKWSRIKARK